MIKRLESIYHTKISICEKFQATHFFCTLTSGLEVFINLNSQDQFEKQICSMYGKLKKKIYYRENKKILKFDLAIAGKQKIRIIYFKDEIVETMSKNSTDKKAYFDAKIRLMYPEIPSPKIYELHNDIIKEKLIINQNLNSSKLTHPKDALLALNIMLPIICKYAENRKDKKYYSVVHGQLYKNDHILKDNNNNIFLVDWSEGGNKDNESKSFIFFDIISCIRWCLIDHHYSIYYYFRYINDFLNLIFVISKKLKLENYKIQIKENIENLLNNEKKFLKKILYKNLIRKVLKNDT